MRFDKNELVGVVRIWVKLDFRIFFGPSSGN